MKKVLSVFAVLMLSSMAATAVDANQQKAYDDFMLKLKACTPTTAELYDGKYEVLGYNKTCGYKVEYKTGDTYTCNLPTPVAEMLGYLSTKTLREGTKNTFAESVLNNTDYCKKN